MNIKRHGIYNRSTKYLKNKNIEKKDNLDI